MPMITDSTSSAMDAALFAERKEKEKDKFDKMYG